jgi:anaerobic ribonucleoside-triphosphate reductase activating protein
VIRVNYVDMVHSWQDYPTPSNCMTVYFSGCDFNCKGCHNKELQNSDYGEFVTTPYQMMDTLARQCNNWDTNCITLMGGEPFHPHNLNFVKLFIDTLFFTNYKLCIYTGYQFKDIPKLITPAIPYITYLKCGRYEESLSQLSKKTDEYFQLASTNQEIYHYGELVSKDGVYKYKND